MAGHDAGDDRPIAITLPDPCLVVLIGAAGAGKSTFASRHFGRPAVLSSDAFRERIAGDPRDQGATRPAFAALHRALARDSGGLRPDHGRRRHQRHGARPGCPASGGAGAGVPAVAIVLDLPADVVLARNATRGTARGAGPAPCARTWATRPHARRWAPGARGLRARLADPAAEPRVRIVRAGPEGSCAAGRLPPSPPSSRTRPNGVARSSTQTPVLHVDVLAGDLERIRLILGTHDQDGAVMSVNAPGYDDRALGHELGHPGEVPGPERARGSRRRRVHRSPRSPRRSPSNRRARRLDQTSVISNMAWLAAGLGALSAG